MCCCIRSFKSRTVQLLFAVFISLFLFSCSAPGEKAEKKTQEVADSLSRSNRTFLSDCRKLYAEARRMDSILLQQTTLDKTMASSAISAFVDFANYCHQDSLSPMFLIKCAQVAKAINNIPQAKLVLDKCISDYPHFRDRPAALFLLAQLYDEDTYLNNESEAKRLYEEIISDYPESDWALSAKGAINFLGKSDEQIIEELKKKNKK